VISRSIDLVLGAGPIGLVAAYLRDGLCVGAEVGGGDLRRYAPTFLWRTAATERLLQELGLPREPRTVRFGYLGDTGVKLTYDQLDRLEYYRRSRGIESDAPVEVPRSVMSGGQPGVVETFDLEVDELVEVLLRSVEVCRSEIRAIGVEGDDLGRKIPKIRVVCEGFELLSNRVTNTLPAPVFDHLLVGRERMKHFRPTPCEWLAGTKTFQRIDLDELDPAIVSAAERGFAYLYVVSRDRARYPFDRVSFHRGRVASLEFNHPHVLDARDVLSGPFQVLGPSRDPIEFGGAVRHVGRFARWRHDVRLHDVVEELYDE
jgi:hypothetical protein